MGKYLLSFATHFANCMGKFDQHRFKRPPLLEKRSLIGIVPQFLDALASLRSILRPTDCRFLIAKITSESISKNETVLC